MIDPIAADTPPAVKDSGDATASQVQPCPVTAAEAAAIPDIDARVAALMAAPAGTTAFDLFCPK